MSVELIIRGDYINEIFGQVMQIANAISQEPATPDGPVQPVDLGQEPQTEPEKVEIKETNQKARKLTPKEQGDLVKKLFGQIEKDGEYDEDKLALLTPGRVKKVLEAKEAYEDDQKKTDSEEDLSDMFAEPEKEIVVNLDSIRDLMTTVSRDENDVPVKEKLIEMQKILVSYVAKDEEIKISNIPEDKLTDFYNEIKALED